MNEIDLNQREVRWKFIPQTIPEENWQQLRLELWQSSDIDLIDHLTTAFGELYVLLARLAMLLGLPDMTDAGGIVVQGFVEAQAELISDRLQRFYDAIAAVAERISQLSPAELSIRLAWQEMIDGLSELYQLVKPADSEQGLTIADIAAYVPQLEQAAIIAEGIKLYWLSDVISHEEV